MLRLASVVCCLVVIVSFGLFALGQTSSASAHQQEVLGEHTPAAGEPGASTSSTPEKKSSLRKRVDDVAEAITSPFSGVTKSWSSQWVIHIVDVLLVLLVYGFGLGFLSRMIRVRV